MSEGSAGKTVGAKTVIVLMTVLTAVFLVGLLIMNNYYTSMQSELSATRAQVSNLQTEVNNLQANLQNLNNNYTLLQEVRNYLLSQVSELSEKVNMSQAVSRTFSYNLVIEYDNKTVFVSDGMGNETSFKSPMATIRVADLAPQTGESPVADPWAAAVSRPLWLKEPVTENLSGIILYTSAVRNYFSLATSDWAYESSWQIVEAGYREYHDIYNITMTGTVQLLYFSHNKTVSLALIDSYDILSQFTLTLP